MTKMNAVRPPVYSSIRLRYPTPAEIVRQTEVFLEMYGKGRKGFRPSDIPSIPIFKPHTRGALLVLVVCFESLERTIDAWWEFINPPPGMTKYRVKGLKSGPENLRLAPGIKCEPGVRWVEFDPVANSGMTPEEALAQPSIEGSRLAHVEVLMAAAQYPKWVLSWDGRTSPLPNMSGLQVRTSTGWSDIIFLNNWGGRLTLGVWGAIKKLWSSHWASPRIWDIES